MAEVVGSSPTSSTPPNDAPAAPPTLVSAHEFRNRFGWYMQRAAAGEAIVVTHRGQRRLRLCPVVGQTRLVA
jgi:prevent-host-death family protein